MRTNKNTTKPTRGMVFVYTTPMDVKWMKSFAKKNEISVSFAVASLIKAFRNKEKPTFERRR